MSSFTGVQIISDKFAGMDFVYLKALGLCTNFNNRAFGATVWRNTLTVRLLALAFYSCMGWEIHSPSIDLLVMILFLWLRGDNLQTVQSHNPYYGTHTSIYYPLL